MTEEARQGDRRYTAAERQAIIATIPWVARAPKTFRQRCEVLRSSAPVMAYWTHDWNQRDPNDPIRLNYRCKNNAHWVFIGLDGRIRVMCWSHLWWAGLIGNMAEEERYDAWARKWEEEHAQADA